VSTARRLRLKDRAGRFLLVILVLAAGAGVVWYRQLAVDVDPEVPAGPPTDDTKADMVIREFRHAETRMDRTLWVLESAQAEVFEQQARLRSVKIHWYGETGTVPLVITSEEGLVDFKKRYATLSGKVRVERSDGAVLLTERLIFDEGRKLLRAPLPLTISTPNFTLRGERLDADLETQHVTLRGPVMGEIRGGSLLGQRPS
jgi:LPS export ABC transporter protein LptC